MEAHMTDEICGGIGQVVSMARIEDYDAEIRRIEQVYTKTSVFSMQDGLAILDEIIRHEIIEQKPDDIMTVDSGYYSCNGSIGSLDDSWSGVDGSYARAESSDCRTPSPVHESPAPRCLSRTPAPRLPLLPSRKADRTVFSPEMQLQHHSMRQEREESVPSEGHVSASREVTPTPGDRNSESAPEFGQLSRPIEITSVSSESYSSQEVLQVGKSGNLTQVDLLDIHDSTGMCDAIDGLPSRTAESVVNMPTDLGLVADRPRPSLQYAARPSAEASMGNSLEQARAMLEADPEHTSRESDDCSSTSELTRIGSHNSSCAQSRGCLSTDTPCSSNLDHSTDDDPVESISSPSDFGSTASSDSDIILPVMAAWKQRIIDRVMESFWELVRSIERSDHERHGLPAIDPSFLEGAKKDRVGQAQQTGKTTANGGAATEGAETTLNGADGEPEPSEGSSKPRGSKRKNGGEEHSDDNDGEGDGSKRPRQNPPGGPHEPLQMRDHKRLACPYDKRQKRQSNTSRASRHTSCVYPGFSSVSRMKEHLYRHHKRPICCPRCHETFESDTRFEEHLKLPKRCPERAQNAYPDGFNADQEKELRSKRRLKGAVTEEEKWRAVYQILFPDDSAADIPSPYCEYGQLGPEPTGSQHLECVHRFHAYNRAKLPKLIREQLEAALECESRVEEILQARLPDIILRCQEEVLAAFSRAEQGNSETTDGPTGMDQVEVDNKPKTISHINYVPDNGSESSECGVIAEKDTSSCQGSSNQPFTSVEMPLFDFPGIPLGTPGQCLSFHLEANQNSSSFFAQRQLPNAAAMQVSTLDRSLLLNNLSVPLSYDFEGHLGTFTQPCGPLNATGPFSTQVSNYSTEGISGYCTSSSAFDVGQVSGRYNSEASVEYLETTFEPV